VPPTPAQEELQALVRVREQILESSVLAKNHLECAPAQSARFFKAPFADRDQTQLGQKANLFRCEIHNVA
jgi:hypothetical protein